MSWSFDPNRSPIVVEGWVSSSSRTGKVQLAVDTGASGTLIGASILNALGIPVSSATRRRRLRAVTGGAIAPVVHIRQLIVFGHVVANYAVTAYDLSPVLGYDGLLGLDFFRGQILTLDFVRGLISLKPPRPRWQFWR